MRVDSFFVIIKSNYSDISIHFWLIWWGGQLQIWDVGETNIETTGGSFSFLIAKRVSVDKPQGCHWNLPFFLFVVFGFQSDLFGAAKVRCTVFQLTNEDTLDVDSLIWLTATSSVAALSIPFDLLLRGKI